MKQGSMIRQTVRFFVVCFACIWSALCGCAAEKDVFTVQLFNTYYEGTLSLEIPDAYQEYVDCLVEKAEEKLADRHTLAIPCYDVSVSCMAQYSGVNTSAESYILIYHLQDDAAVAVSEQLIECHRVSLIRIVGAFCGFLLNNKE